jgi:PKD repeat protein
LHETASLSKAMRRIAFVASLATLALAPSALAVPSGTFRFDPAPPDRANPGEPVTFTAENLVFDGASTTGTVNWSFGDGSAPGAGATAEHTYAAPGTYQVTAVLTNTEGGEPTYLPAQTLRINAPPVAVFTGFAPLEPILGQGVRFRSESSDPDGDPVAHVWKFGDGVTSELPEPVHPYADTGIFSATLTVTDEFGASSTTPAREVVVSGPPVEGPINGIPVTNFAFSPRNPKVGDPVEFVSSAIDPEGDLRSQTWDLNEDGRFGDARGDAVVHTYTTPGEKIVRLRAEDARGAASIRQRMITVEPAPPVPPGFLRPTPRVRFRGEILPRGTRVKILSVQAPRGALVRVTCKGKRCPAKQRRKRIKKGGVRFRSFERFLRAGTRLEIFIVKPKTIGQYTRYTIRAGKGPAALTRCLPPGKKRYTRC